MMPYPYTEVDRFRHPPTYNYAEYRGNGFLDEYVEDRLNRLKERCGAPCSFGRSHERESYRAIHYLCNRNGDFPLKSTERYFSDFKDLEESRSACLYRHKFEFAAEIKTANLLGALLHSLTCGGFGIGKEVSDVLPWCELLVQRFEVSKKIHENYGAGLRKGYGDATITDLYERFALVLCLIYLHTNRLSFLSALLKVNDLLLSVPLKQISDPSESDNGALALGVAVELYAVQRVARMQGVDLIAE